MVRQRRVAAGSSQSGCLECILDRDRETMQGRQVISPSLCIRLFCRHQCPFLIKRDDGVDRWIEAFYAFQGTLNQFG